MSEQTGSPDPQDPTRAEAVGGGATDPGTADRATAALEEAPSSRWDAGRHPVHVAHLVMGLAFAGLVLVWALLWGGAVGGDAARWLLPLPWLLAGAGGLLAAARGVRRRV